MELAGEPDSSHKRGHIEDRGTSGHSGVALGALHEQKEEASQFRGPCLECRPRAQRQPGREANPWERFSAKLEDPKIARALAKMLARTGAPRRSKMTEKLMAARRPDDDDNTQEVALPTDLRSCVQSATGLAIFLSPGWLWRFGALSTLPEAVERLDLTAQSGGAMIALAAFQEAGAALKAVKALDGFDWRFRSGTETPRSQKLIEARRVADTLVFRWLIMHEVHECFSAKIVHDEEAAGSSQKSCKSLSGTESKDPLRLPSPVGGSSAPEASGSVQAPEDPKEPEAGSPSPPAKPRRTARVKLQQTGRRLRWEKSSSEAEAEDQPLAQHPTGAAVAAVEEVAPEMREVNLSDTHLVVTGLPWDWSALQLQMLFTPFGGLALVRLEELAQHAAAAAHFQQPQPDLPELRCQHVLGPREKELLAKAAEAERLRKEAEEEAARQRKAAAAEAERLRQAALFASRRVIWEAANADFAAAVLAEAQPADAERCKRLQAAAESLRDASLSKQRRRMFVALVEAERKRQATMATELEHEAMCTSDAESKAWQQYLLHAEHQYLEMLRQAEAAETLAMSKADRESRRAEQARIDQERRRRRRERESQAAEGRAMKKADDESRRVEAATFLAEEEAREEFEAELMERAEDEVREFLQEEACRQADERRRMAADEAEFFRRQEEERRRQAEEERKQKLVLEWRRKKAARRALESDDEDEAQEPEEEEDQEAKEETSGSPTRPQKAIVRNPFGPVNVFLPQQAPAHEEKAKKAREEEAKRAREEERRRLKDDAAKKRKRETEEAAAELQRFEQELQRRSNFLLRRRQQEEEDLRKEEEAQQRAERDEQERKQREFEASCMAREEKLRMPFELEDRRRESERRKRDEAERRKQERAEKKRKEQEEKLRDERRAEARTFHPQQAARLLQAKEQEIARMQAELLKRRQEEAQKKCQQKQEEEKRGRGESSSSPSAQQSRSRSSSSSARKERKNRRGLRRHRGSRSRSVPPKRD
ncbi:unnamed protein product, partial [Symbiodinium necroappetens]